MHAEAWTFLVNKSLEISPKSIIDIGGRNINGTPRDLWPKSKYVTLDHIGGKGVDIVAARRCLSMSLLRITVRF